MISRLSVTAATAIVVTLTGSSSPAHSLTLPERAAVDGAAGIGDSYYPRDGNGGYDVSRYRVHVRWREAAQRLVGRTRITLTPTQRLRSFTFDLLLPVQKVRVDGRRATVRRLSRHDVAVVPKRPLAVGKQVQVQVEYAGKPARYSYPGDPGWWRRGDRTLALGEPHTAPWWFPANDHPSDAAELALAVRVKQGRQVISNGLPDGRTDHGGTVTWRWRSTHEMTTYSAFFAVGRFEVERGNRHGLPWLNAVSADLPPQARKQALRQLRRTPQVVDWLAHHLGDYPFEATGGLVFDAGQGYHLENQTRPVYSGIPGNSLLVHELGHQWFGDSVRLHRWADIWLNEGFATWLSWFWSETHGGASANETLADNYRFGAPSGPVADPGVDHMWGGAVYGRGAMTVQALRNRIGDDAFFALLRRWVDERGGRTGTTAQFEAMAEDESGEDLDGFFDAWLHTVASPEDTDDNGLGSHLP